MANPKCRYCGKKLTDKKSAYKIYIGSKPAYFCNKEEYQLLVDEKNKEKRNTEQFLKDIEMLIDMYLEFNSQSSWNTINKEFKTLSSKYQPEYIYQFVEDMIEEYSEIMNKKIFDTEFGKARYFITIIKNNIEEYIKNHPLRKNEPQSKEIDFYMSPLNYKHKNRRAMIDVEEDDND